MKIDKFTKQLNFWGRNHQPFFFVIDFELEKPLAWQLDKVPQQILFDFEGFSNSQQIASTNIFIDKSPGRFELYQPKFRYVHEQIKLGESYLVNLTAKTEIFTSASLLDIYHASKAKYRLCLANNWVVFSPETFIRMRKGRLETCPMKGTIDAALPDAESLLLNDPKELAEHVTVVDLLRNDLSRFCTDVQVEKFRYTERIQTLSKDLFQTSSTISGKLPTGYNAQIGTILTGMLPAGSVSGAPKRRTCEIIRQAEGEKRGYYTGVAGYFDGESLNSCVLIRFIERVNGRLFYRSGGGITAQSHAWQEYQELIDKVYVPSSGVYQSISK